MNGQLIVLGLTIALEAAGMAVVLVALYGREEALVWGVALCVGLNLVSHTLFSFVLPTLPFAYDADLALAEIAVAAAEGAVYRWAFHWSWRRALAVSVALNALSLFAGAALWNVFRGS